jgi:hypothetical protein
MTAIPTDYIPECVKYYERLNDPTRPVPTKVRWLEFGARGFTRAGVWEARTVYPIQTPSSAKRKRAPDSAEVAKELAAVSPARKVAAKALADLGNQKRSSQYVIDRIVDKLVEQYPDQVADKSSVTDYLVIQANLPTTRFAKAVKAVGNNLSEKNIAKIVLASLDVLKSKKVEISENR